MSSNMTAMNVGPTYKHDCDKCQFLGHLNDHDLYHCTGQVHGIATVVARWSSVGKAYASGMAIAESIPLSGIDEDDVTVRALRAAYLIAKDLGLKLGA